jgi:queuine/archaeosine tRNA-ribosyltransferase
LVEKMRQNIQSGQFYDFKAEFLGRFYAKRTLLA